MMIRPSVKFTFEERFFLHEFNLPPSTPPRPLIALNLRQILGEKLNLSPETLNFTVKNQGKPVLSPAQNSMNLSFNLSHSNGKVLLGIAFPSSLGTSVEIGVDLEKKRPIDALKVAKRFFHPSEYERLLHSSPANRDDLFFTYWTKKEAYVKCLGERLIFHLKENIEEVLKNYAVQSWKEDDFFYAVVVQS